MKIMINLIIFASSAYPLPVLDTLKNDKQFSISLIITRPDRPVGRKQILTPNPVKIWAKENKIEVLTPETFIEKDLSILKEKITEINPDLGLVAHFGLKIPSELYLLPQKETLNIHFSLLPKYRGGAPLEHTIINGDKETGITVLKLIEEFDAGNIVYQEKVPLAGNETVDFLYKSLFAKTAQIIPDIILKYQTGQISPIRQIGKPIYAFKKDLGNGLIDWQKKPEELERYIRALNPNPGTWTMVNLKNPQLVTRNPTTQQLKRFKILKAHLENKKLILDEVQLEGKTKVSWQQFQQSYPISFSLVLSVSFGS